MDLRLSWDLFVLVFFIVIVAYSFIIGRDNTLKVILASYVAALAADASGNFLGKFIQNSQAFDKLLNIVGVANEMEAIVFTKVIVFVFLVILVSVKGAFSVSTADDRSAPMRLVLSCIYAVMSAGLIISVIIVFVSGVSFVGGGSPQTTGTALWPIYNSSELVKTMISNTYLWFSIPAFAFLIHSIYSAGKQG